MPAADETYFRERVAVVTGGGRGIGAAYCRGLAEVGAAVVVADIDETGAERTAESIRAAGGKGLAVAVDVASELSVRTLFSTVQNMYGRVDFLVNNAAIVLDVPRPFKPFWEQDTSEWDRVMAVNAGGVFLCCKYAKPLMEAAGGGRIVNITSDAIWKGYDGQLAYFASKGAVAIMTRCLAREMGPYNVNVNAVAPGRTLSESVLASEFMKDTQQAVMDSCAIKRQQYPEDLVGTILFLCGPSSACITGQTIVVNCGAVMP